MTLGGEKSFKALTPSRWKSFATRAKLSETSVLRAVMETVALVNDEWWRLPERDLVPEPIRNQIDSHIKMMTPILSVHEYVKAHSKQQRSTNKGTSSRG